MSHPTLPKVTDFLCWLRRSRKLSVSAILGYHSMLASVFRFKLPKISTSPVLHDLVWSFKVELPARSVCPPAWDLEVVLCYLCSSAFEPLSALSLHSLMKKILFLWLRPNGLVSCRLCRALFHFLPQVPVWLMCQNF